VDDEGRVAYYEYWTDEKGSNGEWTEKEHGKVKRPCPGEILKNSRGNLAAGGGPKPTPPSFLEKFLRKYDLLEPDPKEIYTIDWDIIGVKG
jgi:hypothetical protein